MNVSEKIILSLLLLFTILPTLFGIGYAALASVGYFSATGEDAFTLKHYVALFESGDFMRSIFFTTWVAGISTTLSFAIAFFLALVIRAKSVWNNRSQFLIQLPLPVPHLAVAILILLLLSQSGLFSRALFGIGAIQEQHEFPELIYDPFGIGIIAVYLWKEIPFLTLVMLSVMSSVGKNYEAVAQSLGATWIQKLRFVTLPLVLRGSWTSLLLAYVFIVGAFEVPLLVGKTYPPMISVLAHQRFNVANIELQAESFAVSTIVSLAMALLFVLYHRISKVSV